MLSCYKRDLQGFALFLSSGPLLLALTGSSMTFWKSDTLRSPLTSENMKQIGDSDENRGFVRTDSEWSLGLSRPEFSKKVHEFGICDTGELLILAARVCTYTALSLWTLKLAIDRSRR